jgi:hypothetical protein
MLGGIRGDARHSPLLFSRNDYFSRNKYPCLQSAITALYFLVIVSGCHPDAVSAHLPINETTTPHDILSAKQSGGYYA